MSFNKNFGTEGFLQEMASKDKGLYVVVGKNRTGRTTLMNQYLNAFPKNVEKIVYTKEIAEYPSNVLQERKTVTDRFANRNGVVISEGISISDSNEIQNALMYSIKINIGMVQNFPQIHGFLGSFRSNPEFKMGSRSLLNRIKGISRTHTVMSAGTIYYLTESMAITSDNMHRFMESPFEELENVVEEEIKLQGMSTIREQVDLIEKNLTRMRESA